MKRPNEPEAIIHANGMRYVNNDDQRYYCYDMVKYADHLELQLAERDKQLAALKNELGHDRVEQAEYIAAQTDQINALNKQLAEMRESVKGMKGHLNHARGCYSNGFGNSCNCGLDSVLELVRKMGL